MYSISLTGEIKSNFSWRVEILTTPFPPKNTILHPFSHILPVKSNMSTSESTPRFNGQFIQFQRENHRFCQKSNFHFSPLPGDFSFRNSSETVPLYCPPHNFFFRRVKINFPHFLQYNVCFFPLIVALLVSNLSFMSFPNILELITVWWKSL